MTDSKKKKRILLAYPKFPKNTYWSFSYSLSFMGKKATMPPLGLITVASMLPKNYKVKLVDLNIEELRDKDIKWADLVFTSSMIVQNKSLKKIIERANELNVPVVAGGPHPTQYYDQMRGVDHFIIGEAESGILEAFLKDFEKGQAKKAYARPVIRNRPGGKEIDEKEYHKLLEFFGTDADIEIATIRPDMIKSPIPRFDLLKIDKYGSMAVQFSRGCPFNCEFCNEPTLFGHTPRLKGDIKLVQEFKALYNLGYRGPVFIVDDNFIGNIRKVKEVLVEVKNFQKQRGYPFNFFTEASINLSNDEELMSHMRDAGFIMVFIGIETVDKDVQRSMNKHHNVNIDELKAVRKIQSYGMEVTAGLIVGNDSDPPDICDKIFAFCQEAGIPTAMAGLLTAIKGSELYERLKKEGRLLDDSSGDNTHSFELNFIPKNGRDPKKISDDYKRLLKMLYMPKNYFKRCKVLLDNLGPHPKPARSVGKTEIKALLRSLWRQSFAKYGHSYRKFMITSLFKHPRLFPEAVRHSIMGYHYFKITKYALKADKLHHKFLKKVDYFTEKFKIALKAKITN